MPNRADPPPDDVPVINGADGLLLFGGPYSNLHATSAMLDRARELGFSADRIVCTGDVVAYGADAAATADLVRRSGIHVVRGNCEEALASRADDCGCGFAAGSTCDRLSAAWFAHADRELGEAARIWMAALPRRIDIEGRGWRLAVVHGSPRGINEFVFASAPDDEIAALTAMTGCDGVIGGHCGIPFTRTAEGLLWHNPGAIGMPANDGTPRTWFSILASDGGTVTVRHMALDYDHAGAASAMRAAELLDGYADGLGTGLWPSLDVLPAAERAATGIPLAESSFRWTRRG